MKEIIKGVLMTEIVGKFVIHMNGLVQDCSNSIANVQWPLLLTWFNFNPSMDK